ncbi:uncharacterized protein LOC130727638 [Lotus japonicus]|uniref:uncharacterized protein LOC130727638 n=1 Tax=Lotus japonicus TaxID=34305 RepID=UPI00258F0F3C|nr:uncharacterized protein LOC130727638 [Lotus japonicus]
MSCGPNSRPICTLLSDHKHDSVFKDFASPNTKLKFEENDLGDNSHHLPDSISCDDPKVAQNDLGDNSLKPDVLLFSEEEARKQFQTFCEENEVEYIDEEVERYRFSNFKKRLEFIAHLQKQNKGKPVAHNDLGDISLSPDVLLFSDEDARQHFARWCHRYGPMYADEQEEQYRFSVFKKELEWVTHQQNLGVACSINDYSDLTHEEKISLLFCRNCDYESDNEQDHTQEPHAEKEKGYLSEDASEDDAFD